MENLRIEKDGKILAHFTTESCLSHYGQPVWVVEDENPEPGPIIFYNEGKTSNLEILGVVGGWLVVKRENEGLAGILWSDGSFHAGAITGPKDEDINLKDLQSGNYQVEGTLPIGALGSVL